MESSVNQGHHIAVAVRDDAPGRSALQWAVEEYGRGPGSQDVLFTLLHVVSDVPNAKGKWVRVSEADQHSVAAHVRDHVLPFLEDMQDLCDQSEVTSSIEVVKNDLRPEAIVEAALKLQAHTLVLGGSPNTTTWGTIAFCTAPGKQPPGCTVISVVDGQKVKEVSGTGALVLAGSSFSPSSVLGVIESEAEGQSNPGSFNGTPNGSAQFGINGMLPLGPSPLNPGSVARREKWRTRNTQKRGTRRSGDRDQDADLDEESSFSLAQGQPLEAEDEEEEEEEDEASSSSRPAVGSLLDKEWLQEPEAAVRSPVGRVGSPSLPTISASPPPSEQPDTPPPTAEEKSMLPKDGGQAEEGKQTGNKVDHEKPNGGAGSEVVGAGEHEKEGGGKEEKEEKQEGKMEPEIHIDHPRGVLGAIGGAIEGATVALGSIAAGVLFGNHEETAPSPPPPLPVSAPAPLLPTEVVEEDSADGEGAIVAEPAEPMIGEQAAEVEVEVEVEAEETSALEASRAAYQAAAEAMRNGSVAPKVAKEAPPPAPEEKEDPEVGSDGLTPLQRARLVYRAGNSMGGGSRGVVAAPGSSSRSTTEAGSGDLGGVGKSKSTSRAAAAMSGRLAVRTDMPQQIARASRSYVATRDRKEQEKITDAAVQAIRDSLGQSNRPIVPRVKSDFRIYTEEEIRLSMEEFVPNNVLGEGSYGIVYKGRMDGVLCAIKQLKNTDARAAMEEIDREIEVQKRCDHIHLVKLFGFSIEDRSLVYELLPSGSLEDRLLCLNNSPPLLWPDRCRIAMETAAALQHLHTRSPPIVHRDVKPANVLLDENLVAKLGDVGLARVMEDLAKGQSHIVRNSVIVGTEHYVDPEYLCARRGYLGPKSDVYSFGIVLLQMLVGGIPNLRNIDLAVEQESLGQLLDPRGGEWPLMLAMDMANLGLWCSEMDRKDRPDLEEEVIPALLEICEGAAAYVVEQEAHKQQAAQAQKAREEGLALALQEAAKLRAAEEEAKAQAQAQALAQAQAQAEAVVAPSLPPPPPEFAPGVKPETVPAGPPPPALKVTTPPVTAVPRPTPKSAPEAQGGCGCVIQ